VAADGVDARQVSEALAVLMPASKQVEDVVAERRRRVDASSTIPLKHLTVGPGR
jgi:hypothetical protein